MSMEPNDNPNLNSNLTPTRPGKVVYTLAAVAVLVAIFFIFIK